MNITRQDKKLFKNIPESLPERTTLKNARGLNRFLWLYIINYGCDNNRPSSAAATVEMGLIHYTEEELKENGIVEFPPSDEIRYYPKSGGEAYVHYFDVVNDWETNMFVDEKLEAIQSAGQELNKARKKDSLGGRLMHLVWIAVFAAIGYGAYRFGSSDFMKNAVFIGVVLTLPLMLLILICGIAALYNLWHIFVPDSGTQKELDTAKEKLREAYCDMLRYIRLRVLWYQCLYNTDEIPKYLRLCQERLDRAVRPWKGDVA